MAKIGREIFTWECYLKRFYLHRNRWKNINKEFFIFNYNVYLTPDRFFELLFEIPNDLTMNSDAYLKLLERMECFRYLMIFSLRCCISAQVNVWRVFFCPVLCNQNWHLYIIKVRKWRSAQADFLINFFSLFKIPPTKFQN